MITGDYPRDQKISGRSRAVRDVYEQIHASDRPEELWHQASTRAIQTALSDWLPEPPPLTVNVGAGGFTYDVLAGAVDIDTSIRALVRSCRGVAGDARALPFKTATFEAAVCVGSVVNYTSLGEAVAELWRILMPGGALIVEYERAPSGAGAPAILARDVTYRGRRHRCWFYNDRYVLGTLHAAGFGICSKLTFHILSRLLVRAGIPAGAAALAARADPLFRHSPLAKLAANVVLLCRKPR